MIDWIVGLFSLYTLIKIYISVMQIGYIDTLKRQKPVLMPEGRYIVAANYAIKKERISIVESFIEYLLFLWWVFGGFSWLQKIVGSSDNIENNLIFLFGFFAINFIVGLPVDIYQKFKLDKAFGFNTMTPKLYIIDMLK